MANRLKYCDPLRLHTGQDEQADPDWLVQLLMVKQAYDNGSIQTVAEADLINFINQSMMNTLLYQQPANQQQQMQQQQMQQQMQQQQLQQQQLQQQQLQQQQWQQQQLEQQQL